jgi:hypothetical protein
MTCLMDNVFEPASIFIGFLSLGNHSFTFLSKGRNMRGAYSECEIDREFLLISKPRESTIHNKF